MKCLVTGHKGYIGNKMYKRLLELGHNIRGIDLKEGENIISCLPDEHFDYVFHFAALPRVEYSVENPSYTMKQNVLSTSILLEWAKKHNVKRVIFSSSSATIGDGFGPKSPYGLQKLISEMECKLYSQLYKLDTVSLRYFNVFSEDQEYGGAYSTVICAWIEMLKKDQRITIEGDGTQTRDFVHVNDIIDVNLFCMNYKENFNGMNYDVGTGVSISINVIKDIVNKYHTVDWAVKPARKGDVKRTLADTSKLKNIGWCAKIDPITEIINCFKTKE